MNDTFDDFRRYKVLLVDDNRDVLEGLVIALEDDYALMHAHSGAEAIDLVRNASDIAVAVMDIKMAGMSGIEAAREIRRVTPDVRVIFHTAYPGEYDEDQIDAAEKPFGYVRKSGPSSRLAREVRNAMQSYIFEKDGNQLAGLVETAFGLVGNSEKMRQIYSLVHKIARSSNSVMILGETGVGKGLVARAIHEFSDRSEKPFKKFNCNHTPPDLIESELFGHVKGAYSGAHESRVGLFEFANGGTVFLDEIGDLSMASQGKILDVIETGEFEPLGWTGTARKTNIRVVCATNKNIQDLIARGDFREDLYYRLAGAQIVMPPLRERRDDIPLLVEHFLREYAQRNAMGLKHFDTSAMDVLMRCDWPGNVRQLQHTVQSLIALTDSHVVFDSEVNQYLGETSGDTASTGSNGDSLAERIRDFRRACIVEALQKTGGNVNAAARALNEDPSNLRRWIKTLEIPAGRQ
jgi:DNA-binding NtrC family response regulator